ncbi:hypothetical protein [Luteimonas saliphila]|uniref:hypothetical protein n=1 Tax=Luteimonas saliphila TaxID=2804919 RepID=UPI00192D6CCC|nr:hypothetical protein [Luteimonas saliphila]
MALSSSLLFVGLVSNLPIAILSGAGHDDAWFWLRARAIASGSWLGGYDQHTLIKGPGYPLFLAVNHGLGLSVATSQALLYSVACLLLGHAIYRVSDRPGLSLLLVVAMQWHPAAMTWTRVLRDNLSASQALLVLACVLQAVWVARSPRARLAWASAAGVTLGWFWTTREDGIWMLPGVALLLLAGAGWAWRDRAQRRSVLAACAWTVLATLAWLSLVATTNGLKYGAFTTVELKSPAFSDALGALQGVREGDVVPFVPVPERVREAVYAVSPSFARLRPALEEGDRFWLRPGCTLYGQTCGDYAGGWFLWALRDAAASVGAHASAPTADAFYAGLADEVRRACEDGRLTCKRPLLQLMPAATAEQWRSLPGRLRTAAGLLSWQGVQEAPFRSHLDHPGNADMWRFVGGPRVPDKAEALGDRAVGWMRDPHGGWIRGRCGADDRIIAIDRLPSPDVAAHLDDPTTVHNRFRFRPPGPDCDIELPGAGRLALSAVEATPGAFSLGGAQLYLDGLEAIPPQAVAPAWSATVKRGVWLAYERGLPWLAGAGLLAFAWALLRAFGQRRLGVLLVLAATGWGLVASRALLLALVDLSSFPALNHQYLQAAFPLLVLAAIASLAAASERPVRGGDPTPGDSPGGSP